MLSPQEKQFLYWVTRDYYGGNGEIIDAGCFAGGSTLPLAVGLKERWPQPQFRVNSHDRFIDVDDYSAIGISSQAITELMGGASALSSTQVREKLVVHDGDITTFPWKGQQIEILFLDVCKTWEVNDYTNRVFFSHPGTFFGHPAGLFL